ncbi:unnamed protein product [Angiostrongylus costaricensis]|uniref:IlGF domain-containing protein n=1 Tax=Angiostrongylus costaricensis TaxID=334426 RepID=A0A0R3PTC1_ANGCS|nr:unnamed protein product [Angiostrongylus costaricensis]
MVDVRRGSNTKNANANSRRAIASCLASFRRGQEGMVATRYAAPTSARFVGVFYSVSVYWDFRAIAISRWRRYKTIQTQTRFAQIVSTRIEKKTLEAVFEAITAGGPSFLDAFNLICPMRRRRRSISDFSGITSLERTMQKCCEEGCQFGDIFATCNPFG